MNRSDVENWSLTRALALLAALFAIVVGSLMPFAAMAAAVPGQPIVICSTEGLQTIHTGGLDGPMKQDIGAKCASCVLPLLASLPVPNTPVPAPVIRLTEAAVYAPLRVSPPPPAPAPPRPPSRAPPQV